MVFKNRISEQEKFILLSESRLLVFISNFEGYGIPPVEAQYVGTPVLCSDLPVLREVNRNAEFVDFNNQELVKLKINQILEKNIDPEYLHAGVVSFTKFEKYANKLNKIIEEVIK